MLGEHAQLGIQILHTSGSSEGCRLKKRNFDGCETQELRRFNACIRARIYRFNVCFDHRVLQNWLTLICKGSAERCTTSQSDKISLASDLGPRFQTLPPQIALRSCARTFRAQLRSAFVIGGHFSPPPRWWAMQNTSLRDFVDSSAVRGYRHRIIEY